MRTMRTAKNELQEVLDGMPDDAPMDTLLAQMHYKASILRGLADAERGDVVSHEEVRRRLNKWLASSGPRKLNDP